MVVVVDEDDIVRATAAAAVTEATTTTFHPATIVQWTEATTTTTTAAGLVSPTHATVTTTAVVADGLACRPTTAEGDYPTDYEWYELSGLLADATWGWIERADSTGLWLIGGWEMDWCELRDSEWYPSWYQDIATLIYDYGTTGGYYILLDFGGAPEDCAGYPPHHLDEVEGAPPGAEGYLTQAVLEDPAVDYVVSSYELWCSGLGDLGPPPLGSDPYNLRAADPAVKLGRGGRDPREWWDTDGPASPRNVDYPGWCDYLILHVEVKNMYVANMDQAEIEFLKKQLKQCGPPRPHPLHPIEATAEDLRHRLQKRREFVEG